MILSSTKQLPYQPQRIISLVPSQTELLHYLNLNKEVIGITKFCVHPQEWFATKTRIGGTKTINIKLINDLQPNLVIANKEENIKEQIDELGEKFNVWVTNVNNLQDALQMINDIGMLTKKQQEATKLVEKINKEFNELAVMHYPLVNTAYLIWRDPYMTIGSDTLINDMMKRCGLRNAFASETRYPQITTDQIKEKNCRLILLSSEPYPFKEKHAKEIAASLPGYKIQFVNGEYFSWYGSRLLQAPGYFKKILQSILPETS